MGVIQHKLGTLQRAVAEEIDKQGQHRLLGPICIPHLVVPDKESVSCGNSRVASAVGCLAADGAVDKRGDTVFSEVEEAEGTAGGANCLFECKEQEAKERSQAITKNKEVAEQLQLSRMTYFIISASICCIPHSSSGSA